MPPHQLLRHALAAAGIDVLDDDWDVLARGEFADAHLIGNPVPYRSSGPRPSPGASSTGGSWASGEERDVPRHGLVEGAVVAG